MTETSFDLVAEVRDLCARRDILDAVHNYMRGQDRLDPAVQRKAFHDDAHVDCGLFAGGPDEYVSFAQGFLADCKGSQHLIGQVQIRVDGDVADGEVYFMAWHRIVEDGADKDLIMGGRYVDRYACRNGVWKIVRRRELIDWARTDPAADGVLQQMTQLYPGGRYGADFSEQRNWPA